jgi:hypothetical protein
VAPEVPSRLWLLAAGLLAACGSPSTRSSLDASQDGADAGDGSGLTVQAKWQYRSTAVDVDLALATTTSEQGCFSSGKLVIDKLTAARSTYANEQLNCADLRLSDAGDIILYDLATGHDWSQESLDVDTDREAIELGPWLAEGADPILFTISAPSCGGGCDCPELRRSVGSETVVLPLGRRCN